MATEAAIAKSDVQVLSKQLDFSQKSFKHPSYRYQPQFPNTYGQPIVLNTSRVQSTINIPPIVFNWAPSYLTGQLQIPAPTAGNYTWTHGDIIAPFLSQIQHYANTNQYIVDVDNVNNYMNLMKKEIALDDLVTLDPLNGLSVSNQLGNAIPAIRNNGSIGGAGIAASSVNFTECAYFYVGAINTAVTVNFMIPMRMFKNTAFSIDKDIYYGVTSYLKLYLGPVNKVCYMSAQNANPSTGPLDFAGLAGATVSIVNLQLMLAVEDNPNVAEMVKQEIMKGVSYMIPYVQNYKNNNNGSSQSISLQFDLGMGHTLQKVYHQVYNITEANNTAYDVANNGTLVTGAYNAVANQKVRQFYTQLNGKREQDLTIDCTGYDAAANPSGGAFTDYMYMKRMLKGSMLQNLNIYQYNWFWCSDYCDYGAEADQQGRPELVAGIPLTATPLTWTFYGSAMTNAQYQHYDWAVFSRRLTLNGNGALVN